MVVSNTYSVVLFVLFVVVYVLCIVVSNTYSVVLFVLLATNKTNNTTLYVLDTTIHKTQDDNKQLYAKWLNWSHKFHSWISSEDIEDKLNNVYYVLSWHVCRHFNMHVI
jgi:hypothetical protein